MGSPQNQYNPDYAIPPGWILEERLEAQNLSQAEFARRCGRSPKLISEIISGKGHIEPKTALEFERVLGVDASIWLGLEKNYQLHEVREAEREEAKRAGEWAKAFPTKELARRGIIEGPCSDGDLVPKILSFFGVATIDAWNSRYGAMNVAFRHSQTYDSCDAALATWLRLGELRGDQQELSDFNKSGFKKAVKQIRGLTTVRIEDALKAARELCNDAGVALAIVKPLPKVALSGAAWWTGSGRPLIQLSARHKSDDHLWFSFFHEAAHILLHSKKLVFVEGDGRTTSSEEVEADAWAADMLVSRVEWARFVATKPKSKRAVTAFAETQGIAPGIVVGMLQHGEHLPYSHMNDLKVPYKWAD